MSIIVGPSKVKAKVVLDELGFYMEHSKKGRYLIFVEGMGNWREWVTGNVRLSWLLFTQGKC